MHVELVGLQLTLCAMSMIVYGFCASFSINVVRKGGKANYIRELKTKMMLVMC